MNGQKQLKKNLGVISAISIVVGSVIGAGVFFKPQAVYTITGGAPGLGIIAWIIGGFASIFAALTYAEIAVLIPKTGGMVACLEQVYGERTGFLAGWMQTVIFYPAFLAGYGITVGNQLSSLIGQNYTLLISVAIIVFLVLFNVLGSKTASRVQILFTICKLIPLFLLMIFGFVLGGGNKGVFTPIILGDNKLTGALGSTLLAVLFAFEGWTNVGAISGEMKNPSKDLPKAIVGGVSIIMFIYLVINISYLMVIPASELKDLSSPASAVAIKIFGKTGGTLVTGGIIISVIGAANGFLMSGSRVAYQLGALKTLPFSKTLSKLNSNDVPSNSIILIGGLACIYSISGQFNLLTDLAVFSCWIFYTLTFIAVIVYRRKRPDLERTYKVPLYPVIPILAIISGVFVVLSQVLFSGTTALYMSLVSIGITLLGLPVYETCKRVYSSENS